MSASTKATLTGVIDGDSVVLTTAEGVEERIRLAGVHVPSTGTQAKAAVEYIKAWVGREVTFQRTCCGYPHGETPARVVEQDAGASLGAELLRLGYATRWKKFEI